ncbi:D-alanyl-D-alanine carboxypeptidase (penicillin-binding protein 4) [Rubidibacter lacunae KORDI 51-2]|uniref:D-alanyl-D-alanine carboxypeptidase (Penicillin-binding protein 4) n=1 Tax=Rubidibacter lacunae KORDI 51-2 TaxID=582515 RepID=U5DKM5_9CHRO|nr:D-alanyl-D-alanine carboxypeptidase [Rubidibacter lacunae]ERN40270.1 D-alanyl-D-alanine carboxypeptidase (penicillin-binding protein 4) [Rubidibacter lacunae KORDI 51-2]
MPVFDELIELPFFSSDSIFHWCECLLPSRRLLPPSRAQTALITGLAMGAIGLPTLFDSYRVPLVPLQPLAWQLVRYFELPPVPDPSVEALLEQYLARLRERDIDSDAQGICIASAWGELAGHRSREPLPVASLTKLATTYAALQVWELEHRFVTRVRATGVLLEDGTLTGDLLVLGEGDPLFVWEEAIAIGNALNELGIRQVQGDLVVVGEFAMNFRRDRIAAQSLQQALDARRWSAAVKAAYRRLPDGTPRPEIAIRGLVRASPKMPSNSQLLLERESLPLVQVLKLMNAYSNNAVADALTDALGGAEVVAAQTIAATGVSASEVQLINGSGLGAANLISPRATCRILIAIARHLASSSLTLADVLPVARLDAVGTLVDRELPSGVAAKTGTLWNVSSLAGVIPFAAREDSLYFAIANTEGPLEQFREEQDWLVAGLARSQVVEPLPTSEEATPAYGDPERNR